MRKLLLAAVAVFAGCSPVTYMPYQELGLPPTTEVEVLQEEPTEEYEVLGEMWVPSTDTKGVLRMREKAMEEGADAIILLGTQTTGAVAFPLQGGGAIAATVGRTYAVAIRYKEQR